MKQTESLKRLLSSDIERKNGLFLKYYPSKKSSLLYAKVLFQRDLYGSEAADRVIRTGWPSDRPFLLRPPASAGCSDWIGVACPQTENKTFFKDDWLLFW